MDTGVDWAGAVSIQPGLQPVAKELLTHKLADRKDRACHDIMADKFWGGDRQHAFFDVQVFNPFALQHSPKPMISEAGEIHHHVSVRHMMTGDIIDLSTTEGRVTEHFTDYCAHSYFYYYSLFPFS